MLHILMDEGEVVGVVANTTPEQITAAVSSVDAALRKWIDVDIQNLEQRMCEDLGIAYSNSIADYNDVLLALLVEGGATLVEHQIHETVPPFQSAGRTEEEA